MPSFVPPHAYFPYFWDMEMKKYNRIQDVLEEKGIKQIWLAQKLSKGKGTVSRWCRNDHQPSIDVFFQIAALLNVPVCSLFVEENPFNDMNE
jgi:putative transcriptional regulator